MQEVPKQVQQLGLKKKAFNKDQKLSGIMAEKGTYTLDEAGKLIGLNLEGLELFDKQIAFIWELTDLQALNLSENKLQNITVPGSMKALQFLNLSENKGLESMAFESGLPKLKLFDLSECNLQELVLPDGFPLLETLIAYENKLTHFSIEGECPALKFLDLRGNLLTDLAFEDSLSYLEFCYLHEGNKVGDLNFLKEATALQTLNLTENAITDISPIRHLLEKDIPFAWEDQGSGVLLKECPLKVPPPEIISEGNASILNYFQQQDEQGTDTIYEAKLLIVGEGGAGKTSLCRRLLNPKSELPKTEESTKGIDIHQYKFSMDNGRDFRINIWDFGGQEIYHATHQFFLTKRSLYILLDDTKKDYKSVHDEGFKFWLEVIDLLSGHSPVLIFQNEKGGRSKAIDFKGIVGQFDNVIQLYNGDLINEDAIIPIKEAIELHARQLPHIGEQLPKKWVSIRSEIEKLALEEPHISQKEYFKIYEKHLPFDRKKALHLSQYFHDLGVFLHFQEDDILSKTVILQNTWATEAVFKVLDNEQIKGKLGRFTNEDCERIWEESEYADMHGDLKALMTKFELCYPLRDVQPETWLAPQLLPPSKPDDLKKWEEAGDLELRYKYDFMPKGIINRLMVRQHRFVSRPELGWKNGVLFENGKTECLARVSEKGDEIILRARGVERKELLTIISSDLEALHRSFEGLMERVMKKVPCICPICLGNTTPEFYDYKQLIRRKEHNKTTIECRSSYKDVLVSSLLEGFEENIRKESKFLKKEHLQKNPAKKKLFFSYSKSDRTYLEQFQRHLTVLQKHEKIEVWDDHQVLPGEEWDEEIKQELAAADIILLLVSVDFLSTDYIWREEITKAMERHEQGEARVIPIILRPCDWSDMPFRKLNGLPTKGKPVSTYTDPDEAWLEVVKGIKKVI